MPEPGSSLLHPSGSLEATIAHRLRQPSFTTSLCTGTETADKSNGCIAMVMGNACRENETLIYDHLHRRSKKSEGLENYPENLVECHERLKTTLKQAARSPLPESFVIRHSSSTNVLRTRRWRNCRSTRSNS